MVVARKTTFCIKKRLKEVSLVPRKACSREWREGTLPREARAQRLNELSVFPLWELGEIVRDALSNILSDPIFLPLSDNYSSYTFSTGFQKKGKTSSLNSFEEKLEEHMGPVGNDL